MVSTWLWEAGFGVPLQLGKPPLESYRNWETSPKTFGGQRNFEQLELALISWFCFFRKAPFLLFYSLKLVYIPHPCPHDTTLFYKRL